MKKFLAIAALLFASLAFAQTTVQPGGATFSNITGTFLGFVNRLTGAEEALKLGSKVRTNQTTPPTCTTNCGTSPTVVGTDSVMIVTMGASGSPASAWVVTFNSAWTAVPACIVQSALASMVVGKMAIATVVTTTTMTVTTNGTAPANSDVYQIQCMGVS